MKYCFILILLIFSSAQAHELDAGNCFPVRLFVAVSPGSAEDNLISGNLCLPSIGVASTIQVLTHGGTYDHTYWNWPLDSGVYSYVRFFNDAGYATFDYDRLGAGKSEHPASNQLTLQNQAYVLHQIVTRLRDGQLGGMGFKNIVSVGHSIGSYIVWEEAGAFHDVDGVIVSGIAHAFSNQSAQIVANASYPAEGDRKFALQHLDQGYLTTRPGVRGELFYFKRTAQSEIVSFDELNKGTEAVQELAGVYDTGPGSALSYAQLISVPVLLVDGQEDFIFCHDSPIDCSSSSSLSLSEKKYYSASACLEAIVIPETGHDLNLSTTARAWHEIALGWTDSYFGAEHAPNANDFFGDERPPTVHTCRSFHVPSE